LYTAQKSNSYYAPQPVVSVVGRKGTPFPHLQFMAQSDPSPQIVIMLGKGTRPLSGPKPECSVPPPPILHFNHWPQPYTNQSVLKSLLNCTSEISLSRNATDREFQRHGPATEKQVIDN